MSTYTSQSSVPQGFSIYQPALGAQLQFFPALGTKQLDDMINAYVPGPMSLQEKRAALSLDFLGYSEATGQSFKFYAVAAVQTPGPSSTTSPVQRSVSSVSVSPVTSDWDWSGAAMARSTASRSSAGVNASRRASSTSTNRQQNADFSHIPGMKIMTKEGLDVTNTASRGSKTKEQRDHAHLMRIIKACDVCKKKKTRCDPSHKRRGVTQANASAGIAKSAKKTRTSPRQALTAIPAAPPPVITTSQAQPTAASTSLSFASAETFSGLEQFDIDTETAGAFNWGNWDDWMQDVPADGEPDYDFFYDPEGYLSSSQSSFNSPYTDTLDKSVSPAGVVATAKVHGAVEPDYNDHADYNHLLYTPVGQGPEMEQSSLQPQIASAVFEEASRDISECPPPYIGRSGLEGLDHYDSSQYYDAHLLEREENMLQGVQSQSVSTVPSLAASSSSGISSTSKSPSPVDSPDEYADYIAPCPPPHAPRDGTEENTTAPGFAHQRLVAQGLGVYSSGTEPMGHHLLHGKHLMQDSELSHGLELLQGNVSSSHDDGSTLGGQARRFVALQGHEHQQALQAIYPSQEVLSMVDANTPEEAQSAVLQTIGQRKSDGLGHAEDVGREISSTRSTAGEQPIQPLTTGGMPAGTVSLLQTVAPLSSIALVAGISAVAMMLFTNFTNAVLTAAAIAMMAMNKPDQAQQHLALGEEYCHKMTTQNTFHVKGNKAALRGGMMSHESVSSWGKQRKAWPLRPGSSPCSPLSSMLSRNTRRVGLC
ncbi:hypothetical protein N3K66_000967 [Trichothecium roseum]|uniref:Uncharacterized protein n=1 Tax=Trichothecium roseum TaxID=47278 RepID=A0ACC0VE99_9HYPO|nr:hypothetical protein N3K66_000967 [Trichothecium roseum]